MLIILKRALNCIISNPEGMWPYGQASTFALVYRNMLTRHLFIAITLRKTPHKLEYIEQIVEI